MGLTKRQDLDELFHQPVRLEIMAELCSKADGYAFTELRERCNLTDGNLSRHIQLLTESGAVKVKKSFYKSKPLTQVMVTVKGREAFLNYLSTLQEVLEEATERVHGKEKQSVPRGILKRARS